MTSPHVPLQIQSVDSFSQFLVNVWLQSVAKYWLMAMCRTVICRSCRLYLNCDFMCCYPTSAVVGAQEQPVFS
jgi:hypothetical protein